MFDRRVLIAVPALALCLLACGPRPDHVNNSGHEPYLNGDYVSALDAYQGATAGAHESGEPYYNAGNALYRLEEYGDSLENYDESLRYAESELRLHGFFNRGNASFQSQQYAQAIEAYKEVLRMDPDHIDAKHNLELALAQLPPPPPAAPAGRTAAAPAGRTAATSAGRTAATSAGRTAAASAGRTAAAPAGRTAAAPAGRTAAASAGRTAAASAGRSAAAPAGRTAAASADQQDDDQQLPQQTEPITVEQARQILEAVGEDAMTLQERRRQVFVPSQPPSEFDW